MDRKRGSAALPVVTLAASLAAVLLAACGPARPRSATPIADAFPTEVATDAEEHGMAPAYVADPGEVRVDVPIEAYGVVLSLPESWLPVEGEPARFEGASGYVNVTAADSGTGDVRDLCKAEAEHKLQPYGTRPTVDLIEVDGQAGCMIVPSLDQMVEGNWWGALVLRHPAPVLVGTVRYPMVIVTANIGQLEAIRDGLRFR